MDINAVRSIGADMVNLGDELIVNGKSKGRVIKKFNDSVIYQLCYRKYTKAEHVDDGVALCAGQEITEGVADLAAIATGEVTIRKPNGTIIPARVSSEDWSIIG